MLDMYAYLRGLFVVREQKGQTMAEYAVVLAVITLIIVVALGFLSGNIGTAISSVGSKV